MFYNGTIDQPDEKTLRLSESFPEDADADIEVKVRMLNVNVGRNKELLDACKPLGEYSWLVDEVRRNNTTKDEEGMSSAIDKAISSMPDDYVIQHSGMSAFSLLQSSNYLPQTAPIFLRLIAPDSFSTYLYRRC